MCLTAKPTVEWTLSTVQTEPAGMGVVAMALIVGVLLEVDRGPFLVERTVARKRTAVQLYLRERDRASPDQRRTARARRRRPQPARGARRRRAPFPVAQRRLRDDGGG